MFTIWKFPLDVASRQVLAIPRSHRVLSLQVQDGRPTLWLEVDAESPKEEVKIRMHGTGGTVEPGLPYLGTALMPDGFVWHYFMLRPLA